MGLKNVKTSLPQISKELEKVNSSREYLIKNSLDEFVFSNSLEICGSEIFTFFNPIESETVFLS